MILEKKFENYTKKPLEIYLSSTFKREIINVTKKYIEL